jgi:hypothetical protein
MVHLTGCCMGICLWSRDNGTVIDIIKVQGERNMDFLRILMKQRHAEIMAACRASRLSRLERPRTTFVLSHICVHFIDSKTHNCEPDSRLKGIAHEMRLDEHGALDWMLWAFVYGVATGTVIDIIKVQGERNMDIRDRWISSFIVQRQGPRR